MNKIALLAVAFAGLGSTGCAGFAFASHKTSFGGLYANASTNEETNPDTKPAKEGKSCAKSYLGWVTLGDATVQTAAKNGGIARIASVDHDFTNIIGVYSKYCVRVSGE